MIAWTAAPARPLLARVWHFIQDTIDPPRPRLDGTPLRLAAQEPNTAGQQLRWFRAPY